MVRVALIKDLFGITIIVMIVCYRSEQVGSPTYVVFFAYRPIVITIDAESVKVSRSESLSFPSKPLHQLY